MDRFDSLDTVIFVPDDPRVFQQTGDDNGSEYGEDDGSPCSRVDGRVG